jgi:hypothetical protein
MKHQAGNKDELVARQRFNEFQQGETSLKTNYSNLSGANKTAALNALTNWNFSAASPSVGRENALYVAVALLYVMVGYLIHLSIRENE